MTLEEIAAPVDVSIIEWRWATACRRTGTGIAAPVDVSIIEWRKTGKVHAQRVIEPHPLMSASSNGGKI